jgi:hypothetical protein
MAVVVIINVDAECIAVAKPKSAIQALCDGEIRILS